MALRGGPARATHSDACKNSNDIMSYSQYFQKTDIFCKKTRYINMGLSCRLLKQFDSLDMRLLYELAADSSVSVPALASSMDVSTSVLYSRIKRLVKKGLIKKYTIIIDDSLLGVGVRASVGIKRDPKFKESIHDSLMEAQEVESISEVTGRFDIMIRVRARNLEELHTIVIERIGKIVGIQSTETLVELQKTEKDPAYLIEGRQ